MNRVAASVVAIVMLTSSPPLAAQSDARTAARALVQKWQDAIVNVRVTLKLRMSMGGREMNASDESVDAVGTLIDPSGLTVLSLGALNPGAMMNRIMGGGGGSQRQDRPQLSSEPTDVKIRISDGRELPAKIVLRDEDLDLAFLMPNAKVDKLVSINMSDAARPSLLDEVVVLSRLGRVGGWTPSASLHDISAVIERPRTFFVTESNGAGGSMGTPAFLPNGKVVGLLTLRSVDPGRTGMMAMMGGTEGVGLLPVILPAADVLEIAKQAMGK
jgi:S1-C subfamily serine protease